MVELLKSRRENRVKKDSESAIEFFNHGYNRAINDVEGWIEEKYPFTFRKGTSIRRNFEKRFKKIGEKEYEG